MIRALALLLAMLVVLAWLGMAVFLLRRRARRLARAKREQAALLARAQQQDQWFLEGDPRGVYGDPTMRVNGHDVSWIQFDYGRR